MGPGVAGADLHYQALVSELWPNGQLQVFSCKAQKEKERQLEKAQRYEETEVATFQFILDAAS